MNHRDQKGGFEKVDSKKHLFLFFFVFRKILAGRQQFLAGGSTPPQTPPLNGRSSHLIEAAKRGRLDQMPFCSVPLTTRAPLTTQALPTTIQHNHDPYGPSVLTTQCVHMKTRIKNQKIVGSL